MSLPSILGFALAVGERPVAGPVLGPLHGERREISLSSGALTITGWVAGGAGTPVAPGGGTASDGRRVVLLAGELYHRDRWDPAGAADTGTGDDADALLALWNRYGMAAFRSIEGRYAAVLVDRDRLVVATDHAGSVPLYVTHTPDGVHVATQARSLPASPVSLPGPAVLSVSAPVPGLRGVRRVRAGTAATLLGVGQGPACIRTWEPPVHREFVGPDEAAAAVRDALEAAVGARAEAGCTVVLSGGIDSSAVTALAASATGSIATVSMGTEIRDEFAEARVVAEHVGSVHEELRIDSGDLLATLPWAVAAAEIVEPDIIEYLLPLVSLYRRLPGGTARRILTGYGADIPLGGMHRGAHRPGPLDDEIARDMDTFDGLNEMSPLLSGPLGHWTTHPYWDRSLLDLLVRLEPGLKRREGVDKWVLRAAAVDVLPEETVRRPKLGVHEGSGTTSAWTRGLHACGVDDDRVAAAKRAMAEEIYRFVVVDGGAPEEYDMGTSWDRAAEAAEVGV